MKVGTKDALGQILIAPGIVHSTGVFLNEVDKELRRAVFAEEAQCPECNGRGTASFHTTGNIVEGFNGKNVFEADYRFQPVTIECPCRRGKWCWQTIWKNVGNRPLLNKLESSQISLATPEYQTKIILYVQEQLKLDPYASFILHGVQGVGKTTLTDAIYVEAVRYATKIAPWRIEDAHHPKLPIWRTTADAYLDREHSYKMQKGDRDFEDPRIVTVEEIAEVWFDGPRFFMMEMDKIYPFNDTKRKAVHLLLNALYARKEGGGRFQFVADTNLTPEEFCDEEMYGGKIYRRIAEMCHVIDYFEEADPLPPVKPTGDNFDNCFE